MNLFTHRDVNHIFIGFWYFNAMVLGSALPEIIKNGRTNMRYKRQLFNKNIMF